MASSNRFLLPLDALDAEERALAIDAVRIAGESFGVADRQGAHYRAVVGRTDEDTGAAIAQQLARVGSIAAVEGTRDVIYTADDVVDIHEGVFQPVFGNSALAMRSEKTHEVEYPYWRDVSGVPTSFTRRGISGGQVKNEVARALRRFDRALADLAAQDEVALVDALRPAVRLYVQMLRIHPFFDGNGRTAWVLLVYAVRRADLPIPAKTVDMESRCALGEALRPNKSSHNPLVDMIAADIHAATGWLAG